MDFHNPNFHSFMSGVYIWEVAETAFQIKTTREALSQISVHILGESHIVQSSVDVDLAFGEIKILWMVTLGLTKTYFFEGT